MFADVFGDLGMVMRAWMTMSSSTKTETTAVMIRISMWMRSEAGERSIGSGRGNLLCVHRLFVFA